MAELLEDWSTLTPDAPARVGMRRVISKLFRKKKLPHWSEEDLQLLITRAEVGLFNSSPTEEAYLDTSTLKLRLMDSLWCPSPHQLPLSSSLDLCSSSSSSSSSTCSSTSSSTSCEVVAVEEPARSALSFCQSRMALLLHAKDCSSERSCTESQCVEAKAIRVHVLECQEASCRQPHCASSKILLVHFDSCRDDTCSLCTPAKVQHLKQKWASRLAEHAQLVQETHESRKAKRAKMMNQEGKDKCSRHGSSSKDDPGVLLVMDPEGAAAVGPLGLGFFTRLAAVDSSRCAVKHLTSKGESGGDRVRSTKNSGGNALENEGGARGRGASGRGAKKVRASKSAVESSLEDGHDEKYPDGGAAQLFEQIQCSLGDPSRVPSYMDIASLHDSHVADLPAPCGLSTTASLQNLANAWMY